MIAPELDVVVDVRQVLIPEGALRVHVTVLVGASAPVIPVTVVVKTSVEPTETFPVPVKTMVGFTCAIFTTLAAVVASGR